MDTPLAEAEEAARVWGDYAVRLEGFAQYVAALADRPSAETPDKEALVQRLVTEALAVLSPIPEWVPPND